MMLDQAALSRFHSKVLPEPMSGCFLWIGTIGTKGYGYFNDKGRSVSAHRFSYLSNKGPVPEGLEIHRTCHVRCCVNPDHLEAVTHQENVAFMKLNPLRRRERTHCVHGHELTPENTRVLARGDKVCRTCVKSSRRGWKARNKPAVARLKKARRFRKQSGDCS